MEHRVTVELVVEADDREAAEMEVADLFDGDDGIAWGIVDPSVTLRKILECKPYAYAEAFRIAENALRRY